MRGLKTWLRDSQKVRLVGTKNFKRFHELLMGVPAGRPLRGLTRMLEENMFSGGTLPRDATHGFDPSRWAKTSGRARGDRVDKQLTRVVNGGCKKSAATYKLTKIILEFLKSQGINPVLCQRGVYSPKHRIATAVDLLAFEDSENCLWCIELKVGFAGDRECAALSPNAKKCHMRAPFQSATDCIFNRHAMQATMGKHLFMSEKGVAETLAARFNISDVRAAVLYANGNSVDLVVPDRWWEKRANRALDSMCV